MTVREISIGGQLIQFELIEENQADRFFDFDKFKTKWHKKKVGHYHFTSLLKCLLYYWFDFKYDIQETNLEKLGGMLVGSMFHKEIQDYIESKFGFTIIEYPIMDEFSIRFDLDRKGREVEENLVMLGKVDLLNMIESVIRDIKTTFYLPILEKLDDEKFEQNYGLYVIQVYSYIYYLNKTFFKVKPIKSVEIVLVSKKNVFTKIIRFYYDEKIGLHFYRKLRTRARALHIAIRNEEPPEPEINIYCGGCKYLNLCDKGKEYVAEKSEPVNWQTNAFKKAHPDKKAYIRRNGEWQETKLFIKFKEKNDKKE
jgi:CRISPR/Cas system-associated exonuclease Cas4 (RecB family)